LGDRHATLVNELALATCASRLSDELGRVMSRVLCRLDDCGGTRHGMRFGAIVRCVTVRTAGTIVRRVTARGETARGVMPSVLSLCASWF